MRSDRVLARAPKRWPTTLLGTFGAVVGWFFNQGGSVGALSLAALAGFGLSIAVRGAMRRLVGGIVGALGVAMIAVGWGDVGLILSGFIVAAAGTVIALVSGSWHQAPPAYERQITGEATQRDLWLTMDDGVDPTDDPKPVT